MCHGKMEALWRKPEETGLKDSAFTHTCITYPLFPSLNESLASDLSHHSGPPCNKSRNEA